MSVALMTLTHAIYGASEPSRLRLTEIRLLPPIVPASSHVQLAAQRPLPFPGVWLAYHSPLELSKATCSFPCASNLSEFPSPLMLGDGGVIMLVCVVWKQFALCSSSLPKRGVLSRSKKAMLAVHES